MRVIAIGDIHGRDSWKEILDFQADHYVFIGDYFDSKENLSAWQQILNFTQILDLKKSRPEQVILLLGNHDYHYLGITHRTYSSYQPEYTREIRTLLEPAIESGLLQVCFELDDMLFSHAGITRTWAGNNQIDLNNIQDSVNALLTEKPEVLDFTSGSNSEPSGDEVCQGPLWVRPDSLVEDAIENYIQIVGHTVQYEINQRGPVYFIDALSTSEQFLEIENGEFNIKNLK